MHKRLVAGLMLGRAIFETISAQGPILKAALKKTIGVEIVGIILIYCYLAQRTFHGRTIRRPIGLEQDAVLGVVY